MMEKIYDILELGKMTVIELTSMVGNGSVSIQNGFKQGLIYEILDRQEKRLKELKAGKDLTPALEIIKGLRLKGGIVDFHD